MQKNNSISIYSLGILLFTGGVLGWCTAQTSTTMTIGLSIIEPSTPLSTPVLITPAPGEIQNGLSLFSWTNSAAYSGQIITYTRMISQYSDFSSISNIQDTSNTEALFDISTLPAGKIYWKVLATNELGSGYFSESRYFCNGNCGETNNGGRNNGGGSPEIIKVSTGSSSTGTSTTGLITLIEDTKAEDKIILNPLPTIMPSEEKLFSPELITAYEYAYTIGATTIGSISMANLDGPLIRKDMAKMISEYATKVLNKKPNNTLNCSFTDTTDSNLEIKYYTKLACKLGLMGWEADGKIISTNFNPLQEVSRAQFGTVFSRLLYGGINNIKPGESKVRYEKHIIALNRDNIMKSINNPLLTKELRGRVMTMMMRADKDANRKIRHASAK